MSHAPKEHSAHNPDACSQDFGAALLASTLLGDTPCIHTVGIVAATNPGGRELAAPENNGRSKALREDLVGYGKRQIRGTQAGMEHPFLVANLERGRLCTLGAKYQQRHLIFCQRAGKGESLGMRFQLLGAQSGTVGAYEVLAERKLFARSREPAPGERRFVVPGFEHDAPAVEFRGSRVFTYCRDALPDTPEVQAALAPFLACDRELVAALDHPSSNDRYLYNRRGVQNLRLSDLHELLGNRRPFPLFACDDPW